MCSLRQGNNITTRSDDKVWHRQWRQYPPQNFMSPAPAPPRPEAARRSCPWRGIVRWLRTVQHEPALAGRSWHTACRGQGGSAPRGGACPVARRAPTPYGSGPRRSRRRSGRDGSRCRRAGAAHGPRSRGDAARRRARGRPGAAPRRADRGGDRRDPAGSRPRRHC